MKRENNNSYHGALEDRLSLLIMASGLYIVPVPIPRPPSCIWPILCASEGKMLWKIHKFAYGKSARRSLIDLTIRPSGFFKNVSSFIRDSISVQTDCAVTVVEQPRGYNSTSPAAV